MFFESWFSIIDFFSRSSFIFLKKIKSERKFNDRNKIKIYYYKYSKI